MNPINMLPTQVSNGYGQKVEISEEIARKAYEVFSHLYGTSQSFERIHERGGFSSREIIAFLYMHTFPKSEWSKISYHVFAGIETK